MCFRKSYVDLEARDASFSKRLKYCMKQCILSFYSDD